MGEGAQEDDHLAARDAGVGELAEASRKEPCLGELVRRGAGVGRGTEVDPRLVPPLLAREQDLDRGAGAGRHRELWRRSDPQRPVLGAEEVAADRVDRADHLRARAEVAAELDRQRAGVVLDPAALLAEDVEVGVAEPVDRLQLVADHHHLGGRPAQRLDQPQLGAVRVLELVDQEVGEAGPVAGAELGSLEEPRREDLEVLEVEAGAPFLRRLEALREEAEQGGQVAVGEAALARLGDGGDGGIDRLAVLGERLAAPARLQAGHRVQVRDIAGLGAGEHRQSPARAARPGRLWA